MKNRQRGITLVEVILTAMIVSMLASVAALGVKQYLEDGKMQVVNADLATLKSAVRLFILDKGFPTSFNPATDLVPAYLPELETDPFSKDGSGYVIGLRTDPISATQKIYIGSRGPDGIIDYGVSGSKDDIFFYVR